MREILIDNNTLDEERILERSSDLSVHLDQFEIDILSFKVRNREYSIDGYLSKLVV
jgi:hypothetical protein